MKWISRIFKKEIDTIQKYHIQYKISFPLSDGNYRETGMINVSVPARTPQEAKSKLRKFALSKVKVTVVSIT